MSWTRGNIKFESTSRGKPRQIGPQEAIFTIDCFPPPHGVIKRYAPKLTLGSVLVGNTLQAQERDWMRSAAKLATEAQPPAIATLLSQVSGQLFNPLTIDTSLIDAAWNRVVRCYTVTVCVQHFYETFEVTARATQALSFGTAPNVTTFPVDDVVAAYQVEVPKFYRFNRHYQWNKRCCNGDPVARGDDYGTIYPSDQYHQFILNPQGEVIPKPWESEFLDPWHDPHHHGIPLDPEPPGGD